jgi:hypothetical protein
MKKQLLVLTMTLLMTLSATFANNTQPVPALIINELNQKFTNATNIQWKTTEVFYKASFTLSGQQLDAFYDRSGQWIGISRIISAEQLPMFLLLDVQEKTKYYTISELFELVTERGTEYFITYKNHKETKVFKGTSEGWYRY